MYLDNNSEILLTVNRGRSLVRPGVYKEAQVVVLNSWAKSKNGGVGTWYQKNSNVHECTTGERVTIADPMRQIKPPIYANATQVIRLNNSFIAMALTRPRPPKEGLHRWLKTPLGKLAQGWKVSSNEDKINVHVTELAESLGGTVIKWDVL